MQKFRQSFLLGLLKNFFKSRKIAKRAHPKVALFFVTWKSLSFLLFGKKMSKWVKSRVFFFRVRNKKQAFQKSRRKKIKKKKWPEKSDKPKTDFSVCEATRFSAVADTWAADTPGHAESKSKFKNCLTDTHWADTLSQ